MRACARLCSARRAAPASGAGPPSPISLLRRGDAGGHPDGPWRCLGPGQARCAGIGIVGGLHTLPASAAPGRVTLMGWDWWVPAWVLGQPRRGYVTPPGRAGLRGAGWAGLPMPPPPASDPACHPPCGHLCNGLSTESSKAIPFALS